MGIDTKDPAGFLRTGSSPSTPRERLPGRRRSINQKLMWGGQSWFTTVGFNEAGQAREIFFGAKQSKGQDFHALLQDASVLLSFTLQCGVSALEIAHSLGGQPDDPSSPIGVIANHILKLQREIDQEMVDPGIIGQFGEAP